jgi:hypothetical protein
MFPPGSKTANAYVAPTAQQDNINFFSAYNKNYERSLLLHTNNETTQDSSPDRSGLVLKNQPVQRRAKREGTNRVGKANDCQVTNLRDQDKDIVGWVVNQNVTLGKNPKIQIAKCSDGHVDNTTNSDGD